MIMNINAHEHKLKLVLVFIDEQKEWWAVGLVSSYGASFGYGSPLHGSCQGLSAVRAEGMVVPSAGAKPWREKKEWRTTPCHMARVLVMAHHSMVRAKASRLRLTTPLNSGAIPNQMPNSIFLNFFSMARVYGTTTPSAQ
ncbi:hypothetical protein Tco_1456890 [Tanacetum coccineum]